MPPYSGCAAEARDSSLGSSNTVVKCVNSSYCKDTRCASLTLKWFTLLPERSGISMRGEAETMDPHLCCVGSVALIAEHSS